MRPGDWMLQPQCPLSPPRVSPQDLHRCPPPGATIWWLEDWAPRSRGMTVEKGQSQLAKSSSSCYYNASNNLLWSFPGYQATSCIFW